MGYGPFFEIRAQVCDAEAMLRGSRHSTTAGIAGGVVAVALIAAAVWYFMCRGENSSDPQIKLSGEVVSHQTLHMQSQTVEINPLGASNGGSDNQMCVGVLPSDVGADEARKNVGNSILKSAKKKKQPR